MSLLLLAAAVLSREAARYTEEFTFSVGVGDDFVMRLSIDSCEDLRTTLHHVLEASRLPKVKDVVQCFLTLSQWSSQKCKLKAYLCGTHSIVISDFGAL
jgi:hypothetical protein